MTRRKIMLIGVVWLFSASVNASKDYKLTINNNRGADLTVQVLKKKCITDLSFSTTITLNANSESLIKFKDKNTFLSSCDGALKQLTLLISNKYEQFEYDVSHSAATGTWKTVPTTRNLQPILDGAVATPKYITVDDASTVKLTLTVAPRLYDIALAEYLNCMVDWEGQEESGIKELIGDFFSYYYYYPAGFNPTPPAGVGQEQSELGKLIEERTGLVADAATICKISLVQLLTIAFQREGQLNVSIVRKYLGSARMFYKKSELTNVWR
ncbi:hypothetical protein KI743_22245 [Vibrio sp. D420a]|uniref:hypothetical protein n=1 Tax=Vibrio sp. D420a TaxID=2836895 RepID=UPI002553E625|nr:hypothetical protein [Vibrio sp. D420a]MDK9764728.1 hypothetical protein [Vibrio sp. D420a]